MTLDEAFQAIAGTGDPSLQDLSQRALDLKNALANNQISASEFTEMVNDLYHEKNINESIQDLALKEHINSAMTALINLASMY